MWFIFVLPELVCPVGRITAAELLDGFWGLIGMGGGILMVGGPLFFISSLLIAR